MCFIIFNDDALKIDVNEQNSMRKFNGHGMMSVIKLNIKLNLFHKKTKINIFYVKNFN